MGDQRHARSAGALFLALFLVLSSPGPAGACPDGYYNACVAGICACMPNSGTVVQGVTRPFTEAGAAAGGAALETWIVQSRNSAIGTSMPVPFDVRQELQGYVDDDVLNRARYKVGDEGILNAANNIEHVGDAAAVTLVDLIIFRGPSEAADPSLWAHELWHVRQYRDWGVHSFAFQYVRDHNSVENPAYTAGNNFAAWRMRQSIAAAPPMGPFAQPNPFVQPFSSFCRTPVGACLVPPSPVGLGCTCFSPFGPAAGAVAP